MHECKNTSKKKKTLHTPLSYEAAIHEAGPVSDSTFGPYPFVEPSTLDRGLITLPRPNTTSNAK